MRPKKVGKVPRPSCSCGPFSRETRGVKFRETMASEAAAARARDFHASISRLLELPARTLILPGQVSEPIPFDGQLLGSQFGEIRKGVPLMRLDCEAFAEAVLAPIPPPPPNHSRILKVNARRGGPDDPSELRAGRHGGAIT